MFSLFLCLEQTPERAERVDPLPVIPGPQRTQLKDLQADGETPLEEVLLRYGYTAGLGGAGSGAASAGSASGSPSDGDDDGSEPEAGGGGDGPASAGGAEPGAEPREVQGGRRTGEGGGQGAGAGERHGETTAGSEGKAEEGEPQDGE